jgi:hypothetical protein
MGNEQQAKADPPKKIESEVSIDMKAGVVRIVAKKQNGIDLINQVPAVIDFDQVLDVACTLIMTGVRARMAKRNAVGILSTPGVSKP